MPLERLVYEITKCFPFLSRCSFFAYSAMRENDGIAHIPRARYARVFLANVGEISFSSWGNFGNSYLLIYSHISDTGFPHGRADSFYGSLYAIQQLCKITGRCWCLALFRQHESRQRHAVCVYNCVFRCHRGRIFLNSGRNEKYRPRLLSRRRLKAVIPRRRVM